MNILNLLLETDTEKLKTMTSKNIEIPRLSELLGEPFILTCYAISSEQLQYISEVAKDYKTESYYAVIECCEIDGKKLNCEELLKKFEVKRPVEILDKLFLSGEIQAIYNVIKNTSGFGNNVVKEIKN